MPHRRVRSPVLAADIKDDVVGAHGMAGQHGSVDHEMRSCPHQGAIFQAQRLTFGAVSQHDALAIGPLRDRAPLSGHRESGATTTEQIACLQPADQRRRRPRRERTEALLVSGEALGAGRQRRTGQEPIH